MYIAYLFLLHFIADFILQPREMGRKKSTNCKYLLSHIGIIWIVFLIGTFDPIFATANALIHMAIDAVIWKGYALSVWKRRRYILPQRAERSMSKGSIVKHLKTHFPYWEDHWFYVTIGLDQFLHAATIALLIEFL
jgi:hypothetical protein